MKVVLSNTDPLIRQFSKMASAKVHSEAAKAVGEFIRDHMIRTKLTVEFSRVSGDLANPNNWPVKPITTPVPGALLSTDVPYAAILERSHRIKNRRFLRRSVQETRSKHVKVAAEAYRRASAK